MVLMPGCDCCCEPCCRTKTYSYSDTVPPGKGVDECPNQGGCGPDAEIGDCAGEVLSGHIVERFCKSVVGTSRIRARLLDGSGVDDFGTIAGVATTNTCGSLGVIVGDHDITDAVEITEDPDNKAYWLAKVPFTATNSPTFGGPYGLFGVRICWCCQDPDAEEPCPCCGPLPPCECQPCHTQENPGFVGESATWYPSTCRSYGGVRNYTNAIDDPSFTLFSAVGGSELVPAGAYLRPEGSPFITARTMITRAIVSPAGNFGYETEYIPVGFDDCNGDGLSDCSWVDYDKVQEYWREGYTLILWEDGCQTGWDNQIGDFVTGIDGGYTLVYGFKRKYRVFAGKGCDWQDKTSELLKRTELTFYQMTLNGLNAIEIEPRYDPILQPSLACPDEENPLP